MLDQIEPQKTTHVAIYSLDYSLPAEELEGNIKKFRKDYHQVCRSIGYTPSEITVQIDTDEYMIFAERLETPLEVQQRISKRAQNLRLAQNHLIAQIKHYVNQDDDVIIAGLKEIVSQL